ncbi:hypothetical protein FANTH_3936 [Fusarium anthophilum]|uniref:Ankyrin n=1 Tax=Fusarium anthophilum TaxID=48485 RepID=A0A8H5E8P0_9HYPO|nr:hypothetical protein FANTH_3936 [Fusarium anthophilum]
MLATSFSSLCFEEICEAISLEDGATTLEDDEIIEEEELLRWCSSLVRVNKSGSFADGKRIQFAHFTVQEYLQSLKTRSSDHQYPQLRDYAVSRVDGANFFSSLCLRFLTMGDMERFPPTPNIARSIGDMLAQRRRRTFYRKSVLTWAPYTAPSSKMGDRTHRLLRKLFHSCKTPSFCLWAIDFIFSHHPSSSNTSEEAKIILSQVITAVLRPEFTPLHMAAAFSLHDICQELLENGSDVLACSRFGTPLPCALGGRGFLYSFLNLRSNDVISGGPITDRRVFHSTHLARLQTVQLLLNVSVSPLTSQLSSETIISLTLSCPEIFTNNIQVIIELLRAGASITAHDVQLFQIRYDRCLELPAFTSDTSPMWSLFPQLLKVLGENLTPGCPRFCPVWQSLDGASSEEVLKYFHLLIILNDGIGMSAFLTTSRADMAKSTDIDPKRPGWNALHLALFERSYRVLDPLLAFGLDPCAENPEGFKPVHMCCQENTYEALQILLRFGGSILDTDNLGRTVWHLAAEMNSVVLLKELLDLGGVNAALKITSKHHETPICAAATRLHLETVSLLLPFCKTEEHWTSSKALSVILYEPRFSGVIQSLHGFGILSQTSCANALLIHGADVNATNDKNFTPLFVAVKQGAIEVVELLIGRGARVDVMSTSSYGLLNVAFVQKSWRMVDILLKAGLSSKRINVDGRNLLGLMTLWACQSDTKPNIRLFKQLLDHGVDLYVCDMVGSSASHYLFTRSCRGYLLCMLGMRLDLQVEKLSSWPDHFFSNGVDNLVDITYSLRYVKPSIGIEGVRQLCGLGTPGTHGLQCRAACWGSVTAIQNLIKLGINDLEHHCREHGSPLHAAIHNRRWEAVKFLVLHSAKVPEDLWKPKNSTLSTANPDFVIRQWLFVGRYTERKQISLDLFNDEPEIKSWSGVWVVRVPLQWRDRKCSVESTLEYAKRRHWLEIEYKSSTIRDTQLVRPKERCGSMSSVERRGYSERCDSRSGP